MTMNYYTLGRSGLRVSRLALGTMTFGTEWGWGADKKTAGALVDAYVEAGGNFFDTADSIPAARPSATSRKAMCQAGLS
jgi:aryl-alcohol dehydrogenase-like predicted oxidoreductase